MTTAPTAATSDLARRYVDPELERLRTIGGWLAAAESGSDDPKAKGAAAALRLYYAHALALPPLAALELSVIKGRVVPSAQLLRALAADAGLKVVKIEGSATSCTAAVIERDTQREIGRATFTIEQARQAGLVKPGGNWMTYPERMLWARASSWAIRDHAPRVALGMVLPDEVEEVTGQPYDVDGYAEPVDEAPPSEQAEDQPQDADAWAADLAARQEDEAIGFAQADPLATEPQRERIAQLLVELAGLEKDAGLDLTDWSAWVEREGRTVSGGPLTRERARHVIEQAESIVRKLRELTGP